MNAIYRFLPITIVLISLLLFTGCLGGSPGLKIYEVTVDITFDNAGLADVTLTDGTGKAFPTKTNQDGRVVLKDLKGTVTIVPVKDGFAFTPESIQVTKQEIISFEAKTAIAAVETVAELDAALADQDINRIEFEADIDADIEATRLIHLYLGDFTLTGDVSYVTNQAGYLLLTGAGKIDGDLSVDAANASVTNELEVTGSVTIKAVSANSWDENYDDNDLNVECSNATIRINQGARSITVTEPGNQVDIAGAVGQFNANAQVYVVGADRIQNAKVDADDVEFDAPPVEIDEDSLAVPTIPDVEVVLTMVPEYLWPGHFVVAVTNAQTGAPITNLLTGYISEETDTIWSWDRERSIDTNRTSFDITMTDSVGNDIPLQMIFAEDDESPGEYMIYAVDEYRWELLEYGVEYTLTLNKFGYKTASVTFVFVDVYPVGWPSIVVGEENPEVRLESNGAEFLPGAEVLDNWQIDTGETGLTVSAITQDGDELIVSFTGVAQSGGIFLVAKHGVLSVNQEVNVWMWVSQPAPVE